MEQSEAINDLAAALAKAQGQIEGAAKAAENPAFKRDGKAMKYADLTAVWNACRDVLSEHGLAVIQAPGLTTEGRMTMTTMLVHSSGQWVRETLSIPLAKQDPQGYGSAVTYARRYALQSFIGIAPEDDDGNAATGVKLPATKLKEAIRKLVTDIKKTGDEDELEHLLDCHADIIAQARQDARDFWQSASDETAARRAFFKAQREADEADPNDTAPGFPQDYHDIIDELEACTTKEELRKLMLDTTARRAGLPKDAQAELRDRVIERQNAIKQASLMPPPSTNGAGFTDLTAAG